MNNKKEKYLMELEARVMKRLEPLRRHINLRLEQDAEFRDRFEKVIVALKVLNNYGHEKISNQRCICEQIYAEDYVIKQSK